MCTAMMWLECASLCLIYSTLTMVSMTMFIFNSLAVFTSLISDGIWLLYVGSLTLRLTFTHSVLGVYTFCHIIQIQIQIQERLSSKALVMRVSSNKNHYPSSNLTPLPERVTLSNISLLWQNISLKYRDSYGSDIRKWRCCYVSFSEHARLLSLFFHSIHILKWAIHSWDKHEDRSLTHDIFFTFISVSFDRLR